MHVKSNSNSTYLYDSNLLALENFIYNSDFRYGCINQRGSLSYSEANKYTIDMWKLINGSLTVNIDSIIVNGTIWQKVNYIGGPLTVSIFVTSGSGTVKFDGFSEVKTLTAGLNTLTIVDGTISGIYITGNLLKVSYCKLERGYIHTGMPLWNKETELLKCMGFYQNIYTIAHNNGDNLTFTINYMFPIEMRKKPTLIPTRVYRADGSELGSNYIKDIVFSEKNIAKFTLNSAESVDFLNVDFAAEIESF